MKEERVSCCEKVATEEATPEDNCLDTMFSKAYKEGE